MTWYTAHYGSWANGGCVRRVRFGDNEWDLSTDSRKEAFTRAQEVADELGVVVTIISERPTGKGLAVSTYKIEPTEV